jgi:hypothetical protein
VAALFDKLEAGAGFRRRLDNRRRAGRDKGGKIRSRNESKRVQRRRLIFVRAFYFPFARLVHMGMLRVIVTMRVEMRMDHRRMVVGIAVTMDVLKRRQNKGAYKRDTAVQREDSPHHWQRSSAPIFVPIQQHRLARLMAGRPDPDGKIAGISTGENPR